MAKIYMEENELKLRWKQKQWNDVTMCRILAELNGCSYADMYIKLASIGLVPPREDLLPVEELRRDRWGKDEINEAVRMRNKGMTCEQIGNILGRTDKAVRAQLLKAGCRVRKPYAKRKENVVCER